MKHHGMNPLKRDYHDYGYVIFPINGGKFYPDAKFAIVELDSDEDAFCLECRTMAEAERELEEQVAFAVADGY